MQTVIKQQFHSFIEFYVIHLKTKEAKFDHSSTISIQLSLVKNDIYLGQSCPWTNVCPEAWLGSLDKLPLTMNYTQKMSKSQYTYSSYNFYSQLKYIITCMSRCLWWASSLTPGNYTANVCLPLSNVLWWNHKLNLVDAINLYIRGSLNIFSRRVKLVFTVGKTIRTDLTSLQQRLSTRWSNQPGKSISLVPTALE